MTALIAIWILGAELVPQPGWGTVTDQPDFQGILRTHGDQLVAVTSEAQAKTFFVTHLAPPVDLKDRLSAGSAKGNTQPPATFAQSSDSSDPSEVVVRVTANLASWRLASAIKQAADAEGPRQIQAVLDQSEPQREWLLKQQETVFLRRATNLASVLSSFRMPESAPSAIPSQYGEYSGYLNRTYPRLTASDDSWLVTAEKEGTDGIRRHLMSFWDQAGAADADKRGQAEENLRETLAVHYFQARLRPVLTAHLVALTIRAEATAEAQVHADWVTLQTWLEKRREMRGLARLCGTWQWTVHNHQNHQDHKMMMVFPPPDSATVKARPAKITVLGDGVYLRWEFQGGYQEDSLLFTGEGQRLEGSFTNSAGAWGSITGKRVLACGK